MGGQKLSNARRGVFLLDIFVALWVGQDLLEPEKGFLSWKYKKSTSAKKHNYRNCTVKYWNIAPQGRISHI